MNTFELDRILNKFLPRFKVKYLGVFPRDYSRTLLSSILDKHSFSFYLVYNTHPSSKSGQQCVVSYFGSTHSIEFFDSYGLTPSTCNLNITPAASNPYTLLQLDSNYFAHYCILYLCHCCRGKSMSHVVSSYSHEDLAMNASSVSRFVKTHTR